MARSIFVVPVLLPTIPLVILRSYAKTLAFFLWENIAFLLAKCSLDATANPTIFH